MLLVRADLRVSDKVKVSIEASWMQSLVLKDELGLKTVPV